MTIFSVDVETTGLNPILHACIAVSVVEVETEQQVTYRIRQPIGGFVWDTFNVGWAAENFPKSYYNLEEVPATVAVRDIERLLLSFDKPRTFMAWPASFDYPFLQQLYKQAGFDSTSFDYRTLDVKSYICGKFGLDVSVDRDAIEAVAPGVYIEPSKEEIHNPYYDALAQARAYKAARDFVLRT